MNIIRKMTTFKKLISDTNEEKIKQEMIIEFTDDEIKEINKTSQLKVKEWSEEKVADEWYE